MTERDGTVRLHVGTYDKAGGGGLVAVSYSMERGWAAGEVYGGARNASFGVYSPRFDLHYFVDEQANGAVGAHRETGAGWTCLASSKTNGAEPCYASLDSAQEYLAVANYGSGSVALFALNPRTGIPCEPPTVRQNHGAGPVADRQDGPHAHCAVFGRDGRWLYHCDLGTDQVLAYPLAAANGALGEPVIAHRAPRGAGPRHLVFHPRLPMAFLVSELAGTLTMLETGNRSLAERQTVITAPADYMGENLGGHLALNAEGDRIYVTNRGHDSIAVFALDDARMTLLQHVPSGGASPRFFLLMEPERLLVLANEENGNLTAFRIESDGRLLPLPGDFPLPGAVFLTEARRGGG
jgi:6-phosphogluconolactonase